jgi:hypothetical protein
VIVIGILYVIFRTASLVSAQTVDQAWFVKSASSFDLR